MFDCNNSWFDSCAKVMCDKNATDSHLPSLPCFATAIRKNLALSHIVWGTSTPLVTLWIYFSVNSYLLDSKFHIIYAPVATSGSLVDSIHFCNSSIDSGVWKSPIGFAVTLVICCISYISVSIPPYGIWFAIRQPPIFLGFSVFWGLRRLT